MNVYREKPTKSEFNWFEHNNSKQLITYDTGEKLAEFDGNGRGRWYYRNGRLALDYYDAEEHSDRQRIVIYSSGESDGRGRGRPYTILATFDYLGNGIVFDHTGKIRLKYNQTEGVLLDRNVGPASHWKWHSFNDSADVIQMPQKYSNILQLGNEQRKVDKSDDEEIITIESEKIVELNTKTLTPPYKQFKIKMKVLNINEHFSLKILDVATIYLIYRDGTTYLKLNIGMNPEEIIDTELEGADKVINELERFPAHTSLAELQKKVPNSQRLRSDHEKSFRFPHETKQKTTVSGTVTLTTPLTNKNVANNHFNYSRKPTANNVYYNTQF